MPATTRHDGRRTPPDLGIVPQEIALYPLLTARENLEAFGGLHGLAGAVVHAIGCEREQLELCRLDAREQGNALQHSNFILEQHCRKPS